MDIDNHPIPQDVSHFQFKLIGDLTLKQFGYLIGSAVVTWFFFALPLFWFIKFPFMFASALIGVVLCFVPIEGRPSDMMLKNFIRALFTPNEFVFDKQATHAMMNTTQTAPAMNQPMKMPEVQPVAVQETTTPVMNIPIQVAQPVIPSVQAQTPAVVVPPVVQTPTVIKSEPQPPVIASAPILTQQVQTSQSQIPVSSPIPTPAQPPVEEPTQPSNINMPRVRILNAAESLAAGFPMIPDVPNIILGIVKDSRANVLPNVLIEVKNSEGNPVRAFKTNPLGQFASATPLQNGTYTIYLEDTGGTHKFDTVVVEAKGQILLPIEVISIDQREELRKQLFG